MKSIRVMSSQLLGTAMLAVMLSACGNNDEGKTEAVAENLKPVGTVAVTEPAAPAAASADAAPAAEVAEPAPVATSEAAAPVTEAAPAAEPVAAAPAVTASSGEETYNKYCGACHSSGLGNAPIPGNKDMWAPRIAKGMDALLVSAKNGIAGTMMPPMGTCATCTDEELMSAVEYMTSK